MLIVSYRGYSGSTGSPTEAGLLEDARAAYALAREHAPAARIVLYGESLGTGVAVALAAEVEAGAVVLDAAFTSAADVARTRYPFVPIGLLMHDQFDSAARIAAVEEPVLLMHGTADPITPSPRAAPSTRRRGSPSASSPSTARATRGSWRTAVSPKVRALLEAVEEERAAALLAGEGGS